MKNAIKYYYELYPTSIRQKDKTYMFTANNTEYVLINYDGNEIMDILEINRYMINNNLKTNEIVLNNSNGALTVINNEVYVLIKIREKIEKININSLIQFNNIYINTNKLNKSNWFDLWTKKIDYLEYQINQVGLKYELLRESFSYYVGLAEIAISLSQNTEKSNYLTLNHRRIQSDDTTFQLYNPLNYIIDYRFRDACEYFKSLFFKNVDIEPTIKEYFNNLVDGEKYLFFARMLFPTYYFDSYEKIINNDIDEIEINNIIKNTDKYEKLLVNIYLYLKNILPEIEWFTKLSYIYNF